MKRVIDVVIAGLGLVVLAPFVGTIAVVLRVRHGSPILFAQERVGRYGRTFQIYKFRTMDPGAGPVVTAIGDPRVHRTGRFLRASKLDELPQLVNVVRGDMSLVGPRPEVPEYVRLWPDDARDRILSVRPGITDPASVVFRNEAELLSQAADPIAMYEEVVLPAKVAMYDDYVATASVARDLGILVHTLVSIVVPRRRGADCA